MNKEIKTIAKPYQICTRCVMDTTDPNITFDENGFCNHCTQAIKKMKLPPYALSPKEKEKALNNLILEIIKSGKGKKYDCVIGLSGGVDSTYVAFLVKKLGLRPLAVHLDNNWNSQIAEQNINNICKTLEIEETRVNINWEEFKNLQLAFLRASTPDSEIPSDNCICALKWDMAKKHNIKYILTGANLSSESILPNEWSQGHLDDKYIKTIYKTFGNKKRLKIRIISYWEKLLYKKIYKINEIATLNYIDYDREKVKNIIKKELNWQDYGRKHGESIYTRIVQELILPYKFGYDKRKAHYSSQIVAGQITREEAINFLSEPLYINEQDKINDIRILCERLGITMDEFNKIFETTAKSIKNYKNANNTLIFKIIMFARFLKSKLIKKI